VASDLGRSRLSGTGQAQMYSAYAGLATDDEGWVLAIGERDGRALLLDTSMVFSEEADLILAMSERLGLVVGAGAETLSGTYWLTAARAASQ
jgi:hypothetical protein